MTMSEPGVLRFASDVRCRLTWAQGRLATISKPAKRSCVRAHNRHLAACEASQTRAATWAMSIACATGVCQRHLCGPRCSRWRPAVVTRPRQPGPGQPDRVHRLARPGTRRARRQLRRALALVGHGPGRLLAGGLGLLRRDGVGATGRACWAAGRCPAREWFPGARLNYAEHVLRSERPGTDALLYRGESTPLAGLPWEDFAGQVRVLATRLRAMGVVPGDRVVSCHAEHPADGHRDAGHHQHRRDLG